jgi:hypothetical protein
MSNIYRDIHSRKPMWALFIVVSTAALMWWFFIQQIILGQPVGTNPGPDWMTWLFTILFGIGLPVFYFTNRLIISVEDEALRVQMIPILTRQIPYTEIDTAIARKYEPILEYGGWGVRYRPGKRAYSMRGNRGVELTLRNGQRIMLGTDAPETLQKAINQKLASVG